MSDFLSQDQIDSLLDQQEAGGFDVNDVSDDSAGSAEAETGPDYNALNAAFELFNEQAGSVISTVLNRSVTFSIAQCEKTDTDALQGAVPAPVLLLTLPFDGGISGSGSVVIGTKEVAVLSDLMMMGDGSAEYTEDHKDAIGELFNQVMGAYTTALGEKCDSSVSAGTIEVNEFDLAEPSIPLEETDMVLITVSIADVGDAQLAVVVPQELGAQLMNTFKSSESMDSTDMGDGIGLSASEVDDLTELSTGLDDMDMGGVDEGFAEPSPAGGSVSRAPNQNVDMLLDVEMDVSIELGKTDLSIKRILDLAPGSLIELDRMAGEPVDLMVNNKVVAKGEVVVVDESFGIRIVSLVSAEERIKSLR